MQEAGQIAPDGNHYWDGQRWVPTISVDGRWRWDGANWTPTQTSSISASSASQLTPQPVPGLQAPAPMYGSPAVVYGPRTNTLAVVSLASGIISWFLCPFVGGIVAVITGHIGHGQIKQSGESGAGMATAGMVLGYIHLVTVALIAIFWILVLGGLTALLGFIATLPAPTPTP